MGKYKLVKTIGKGNFAKVKLAKHMPTGQEVCLGGREKEREGRERREIKFVCPHCAFPHIIFDQIWIGTVFDHHNNTLSIHPLPLVTQ